MVNAITFHDRLSPDLTLPFSRLFAATTRKARANLPEYKPPMAIAERVALAATQAA
jgi:hypothetical protein